MNEMICKQCGSLLESRDLICPCCKTPRRPSKNVRYLMSKSDRQIRENLFDTNSLGERISLDKCSSSDIFDNGQQTLEHQYNRGYAKTGNVFGFAIIGFLFGCFMPVVLAIIIAIACSKKMVRTKSKNVNVQYKLAVHTFRNGLLWGFVIVRIVLPIIVRILGLMFEYF